MIVAADTNHIPSFRDFDIGKVSARITDVGNIITAEVQKYTKQLSDDICVVKNTTEQMCIEMKSTSTDLKTSTDQVFSEIKSSVQNIASDAAQAIKLISTDDKDVITKQSIELSSICSAVDQIKSVAKQTESYGDRLMNSSSVLNVNDTSSWITVMNNKHKPTTTVPSHDSVRLEVTGSRQVDNCSTLGYVLLSRTPHGTLSQDNWL